MNAQMISKEGIYKGDYYELREAQRYLELSTLKFREFIHNGEIRVFLMESKQHKNYKYFFKKEDLVEFKLFLIMTDFYINNKKRKSA